LVTNAAVFDAMMANADALKMSSPDMTLALAISGHLPLLSRSKFDIQIRAEAFLAWWGDRSPDGLTRLIALVIHGVLAAQREPLPSHLILTGVVLLVNAVGRLEDYAAGRSGSPLHQRLRDTAIVDRSRTFY
jgi:hypothetical protein